MKRVTLRGTALIALEVLAPGVASADPIIGETRWPIHDRAPYYATRKRDFEHLYEALIADD
jgi:gluconokinase